MQLIKSRKLGSKQLQTVANFMESFDNLNRRRLKNAFAQWRGQANNIKFAGQHMSNFIVRRMTMR